MNGRPPRTGSGSPSSAPASISPAEARCRAGYWPGLLSRPIPSTFMAMMSPDMSVRRYGRDERGDVEDAQDHKRAHMKVEAARSDQVQLKAARLLRCGGVNEPRVVDDNGPASGRPSVGRRD